jgi:hypothetical protein
MRALLSAVLMLTALGVGAQMVATQSTKIGEFDPVPAVPDHEGVGIGQTGWPIPYLRVDDMGRPGCRRNVLEIGCRRP